MDTVEALGQAYRPRVIDAALHRALIASGAVVIEGARASGKTMTALHAAGSYVFIDDVSVQRALEIAPRSILEGEAPRLLDEWQVAPELWNLVRRAVDATTEPGRFILTGSAVPADDITRHTGPADSSGFASRGAADLDPEAAIPGSSAHVTEAAPGRCGSRRRPHCGRA